MTRTGEDPLGALAPLLVDPYPFYELMRAPGVVYQPLLDMWTVTGFDTATEVLSDPVGSVVNPRRWQAQTADPADANAYAEVDVELSRQLVYDHGPRHDIGRRIAVEALVVRPRSPQAEAVAATIEDLVTQALRPGVELVEALAAEVPKRAFAALLGVPDGDRELVSTWAEPIARSVDLFMDAEQARRTVAALRDGRSYFAALARTRRKEPGDDVLTKLIATASRLDHELTDDDVATFCLQMLGPYETTMALVANALLALARNTRELDVLRRRPDLAGQAVEEALRYEAPVQVTTREVAADVTYGGTHVAAGSTIAVLLGAANRDPEANDRPGEFLVERDRRRHVGFGHGLHACVGNGVARLAATSVVRLLPRLLPDGEVTAEVAWKESFVVRCPRSLSLEWAT